MHLICDNYGTHKHPSITTWLAKHPRFHMHFTPTYSSWINQVERFFAYVTGDLLQRSDHPSVQALKADIRRWVKAWNADPKPFIWTKTAEQILESLGRLIQRTTGAGHQEVLAYADVVTEPGVDAALAHGPDVLCAALVDEIYLSG